MLNLLLDSIQHEVPLTEADRALCTEAFEPVLYPKHHILEPAGQVPRYLYFVVQGFVRLYAYDDGGNEVTTHLNCPPGFITSYFDFVQQTPSQFNVETVTDCQLLRISHANLDRITRQIAAIQAYSIWVFQQSLAYNETRSRELATLSAEQRYLKLMESQPDIIHHVPMQYIASFLGMKPESLSRIRRKIIS